MTISHTNRLDGLRARIARGGRITKVDGEVASCAPDMAGPARTVLSATRQPLLCSVAALALGAALSAAPVPFSGSVSLAQTLTNNGRQCGPAVDGGIAWCNGDGSPAGDVNPYASGITYSGVDGLILNVDGAATTITYSRNVVIADLVPGPGIISLVGTDKADNEDLTINVADTVTITTPTASFAANGIQIYGGSGADVTVNSGADMDLMGSSGGQRGVVASATNGTASINSTGNITTGGNTVGGALLGIGQGTDGSVKITATGDLVMTSSTPGLIGYQGGGAIQASVFSSDNLGSIDIDMRGGSIRSTGDGIYARHLGLGSTSITSDVDITATGGQSYDIYRSFGINSVIENSANTEANRVTVSGGSISTSIQKAIGVHAMHAGTGAVEITSMAEISAAGLSADGIRADAAGGGTYDVDVRGGSITVGAGNGAAVHTIGAGGGNVNLASGTTINAGASGLAVWDETGDVTVTSAANVTGDVVLGSGDDVYNLTGGSHNGSIYGDGTVPQSELTRTPAEWSNFTEEHLYLDTGPGEGTVEDGDDLFVWTGGTLTGGFYGMNGSDTARISAAEFDGSQIIDGGDDEDDADGWIDTLILSGAAGSADMSNVRNWERIRFEGTDVAASNLVTEQLDVCGSATLGGASALDNVTGCGDADTIAVVGDTVVENAIEGGDGDDTLTVDTTGSVAAVMGEAGNDVVSLLAGTVGMASGGTGDDQMTLEGATVTGAVMGDAGNDEIALMSGSAGSVSGGDGNDMVTLDGAAITGAVTGDAGDDEIALMSGSAGNVSGGDGNDTATLDGAAIDDAVAGNAGDDALVWSSGTLGSLDGGEGSDTALVSAAEYDGTQVLDGGDDVSSADSMVDTLTFEGLTLATNGANIVNWENVVVDGGELSFADGMLVTGSDDGTGLSVTNGGVIDGGTAFDLTGNLMTGPMGTFRGHGGGEGVYAVSGNLMNDGTVTMQDGMTGDMINVAGDYSGSGTLLIDADFVNDTADALVIAGDTSGTTTVIVNDVSVGNQTGQDVLIADVGGTSDGDAFMLADGPITSGAFTYDLSQDGSSWYLTSGFSAASPVYEAYAQAMALLNTMPTLYQRVGNRHWFGAGVLEQGSGPGEMAYADGVIDGSGLWTRVEGVHAHVNPEVSTTSSEYDVNRWRLQAGLDTQLTEAANGSKLIAGLTLHYGQANVDVLSHFGSGSIDTSGYGFGTTLTWYGTNGFYTDAQAQFTWFDSDLSSDTLGSLTEGNDGFGYGLSLEAGKRIAGENGWVLTPQAQLVWSSIDFDAFDGRNNARVSLTDGDSLAVRMGMSAERERSWTDDAGMIRRTNLYAIVNMYYEFLDGTRVDVSTTPLFSEAEPLSGELGLGGTYSWNDDKYSVYGQASARTSLLNGFGDSYELRGTAGFKVKW